MILFFFIHSFCPLFLFCPYLFFFLGYTGFHIFRYLVSSLLYSLLLSFHLASLFHWLLSSFLAFYLLLFNRFFISSSHSFFIILYFIPTLIHCTFHLCFSSVPLLSFCSFFFLSFFLFFFLHGSYISSFLCFIQSPIHSYFPWVFFTSQLYSIIIISCFSSYITYLFFIQSFIHSWFHSISIPLFIHSLFYSSFTFSVFSSFPFIFISDHFFLSFTFFNIFLIKSFSVSPWFSFFTNLGSSASSTEADIDTRLTNAWTAIDKLSVIWKSDLTDKMKPKQCTTWTLTKRLEKKLDSNYTRMLRAILNKSWRQHPTKPQLFGHLSPITKTIKVRRTRHVGHCWRSREELISDVLLWTPSYGRAKTGRPSSNLHAAAL